MNEIFYNEIGFKVIKNIAWIPQQTLDYNRSYVTIPEIKEWTRMDWQTVQAAIKANLIKGKQDIRRQWQLEIKSVVNFIEKKYRYKNYGLDVGKWWDKKSIRKLYTGYTHEKVSKLIGRNKNCVKVMRCKLGIPRVNDKFEQVYFVTPHAMKRYKERIIDIDDKYLIWNINDALKRKVKVEDSLYEDAHTYFCKGRHRCVNFRAVVTNEGINDKWPQVKTILYPTDLEKEKVATEN